MMFDHFIIVDWSARSTPSPAKPHRDAIWLAEGAATGERITTKYFRTRHACYHYLRSRLLKQVDKGQRTFVGMDLSYAYPSGTAKALKLKNSPSWKATWELIATLVRDDERNRNNRFAVGGELNRRMGAMLGPFWGVPIGQSGIFLGPKKDFEYPVVTRKAALAEKRLVELKHPKMQSVWKLAYAGSVGSQALMGIPYVHKLRFIEAGLKDHSLVWPFESGFTADPLAATNDLILHAEIWPSLIKQPRKDKIADREQVRTYLDWLKKQQANGQLPLLFDQPKDLDKSALKRCIKEEGWVFGA